MQHESFDGIFSSTMSSNQLRPRLDLKSSDWYAFIYDSCFIINYNAHSVITVLRKCIFITRKSDICNSKDNTEFSTFGTWHCYENFNYVCRIRRNHSVK